MKMKKILSLLAALAMGMALCSASVFADDTAVNEAKIGDTKYATIDEAINYAQAGDTITLLKDLYCSSFIKIDKSITFDLDKHTWTIDGKSGIGLGFSTGSGAIKNGTITLGTANTTVGSFGFSTIESFELSNCTVNGTVKVIYSNTAVISNCTINGVINLQGGRDTVSTISNCTITIDGDDSSPAIAVNHVDNSASVNIEECTVNGVINCNSGVTNFKSGCVNKSSNGYALVPNGGEINITGGTFLVDVSTYCAEGYECVDNGDSTYTVKAVAEEEAKVAKIGDTEYATLAEAVANAADNDTITLINNAEVNSTIDISKNLTINLNGKTLINTVNASRPFFITQPVTFTVDGTAEGSKMSIPEDVTGSYGFIDVKAAAKVILNGGEYSGNTDDGAFVKVRETDGTELQLNNLNAVTNKDIIYTDTIYGQLKIDISGGTYTTDEKAFGIDTMARCPLTFDNVTVNAGTGPCIEVSGSEVTFTNCNFTVTGNNGFSSTAVAVSWDGLAHIYSGTYTAANGYAAYVYSTGGTIEIHDGTFTGGKNVVKSDTDNNSYPEAVALVDIKGGIFNGTMATSGVNANITVSGGLFDNTIDSVYCAEGYECVDNGDGTYTVKAVEECAKLFDKIAVLHGDAPWLFAGIDSLNYGKAGFKYTIDDVESEMEATIICDQVTCGDKTVTAADLGGKYIFGIALDEQFKNAFTVKPFVDDTTGTAVEFKASAAN